MKNLILIVPLFLNLSCGKSSENLTPTTGIVTGLVAQDKIPADAKLSDYKIAKVKILDAKAIEQSAGKVEQIVVEGKVDSPEKHIRKIVAGAPYCIFENSDKIAFENNMEFTGVTTKEFTHANGKRRLTHGGATSKREILVFGCTKLMDKEFTVKEVESAFKDILEITFEKK